MKFNDAIFGAVLLVLGIAVLVHVPSFPQMAGQKVGPALFPGLIAAGLVACALILIVNGVKQRAVQPWVNTGDWTRSRRHIGAFFVTIGAVIAYIMLADKLGFLIIGPLVVYRVWRSSDHGNRRRDRRRVRHSLRVLQAASGAAPLGRVDAIRILMPTLPGG